MPCSLFYFLVIGVPGIIILLVGVMISISGRKKQKHCTAEAMGTVYGYRFAGGNGANSVAPRAEFEADGRKYKAYRHYKGVVSKRKRYLNADSVLGQQDEFWISDNDWFCIRKKGIATNYRKLGEKAWPIGSGVKVIYDPAKPKHAYVEKVVINNIASIVLICCGAVMIAAGAVAAIFSNGKGNIGATVGEDGRIESKKDYSTDYDFNQIKRDYRSEDGTCTLSIYEDEETGYCMVEFISDNDELPSVSGDIYKIKTKREATSLNVNYTLSINTESGQDEVKFTYITTGSEWKIEWSGVTLLAQE